VVKNIPHYLQIKVTNVWSKTRCKKEASFHVGYVEQGYGGKLLESQGG
jgi:hypothetical protein